MSKKINFTADRVAGFTCQPGRQQTIYWDAKTPGLGFRVTERGAKSFVFESTLDGKTLRLTIGDPRTWTVGMAQAEARRHKATTDQGLDPREQRRAQAAAHEAKRQEALRLRVTFGEAWQAYIEARRSKWGERHLKNHMNMVKPGGEMRTRGRRTGESGITQPGPLYPLLVTRLSDLDSAAVRRWLEPLAARTPTQAAQTYRALCAFVAWCQDHPDYSGLICTDACNRRMARDVLPRPKAKTDCLQREQLSAWFAAVRLILNPVISAYLQCLLLTGARRTELAMLRWEDVDTRWGSMTIRDKVEGQRRIPLTPYVATLLSDLPRRNAWVFSSPTAESGRLQEPRIQHRKACEVANIDDLTLHGLRRSFSTLSEWVECPTGIVAQIMGHKPSATAEKHYKVREIGQLRKWHQKIEAWILQQAGIESEVQELEPRVVATA